MLILLASLLAATHRTGVLQVRALKATPDSLVLLRTNMAAGHFAQSGLEDRLAETAFK